MRCIGKVADAYKTSKKVICRFKKLGAVVYDDRILHWYDHAVSIWTLGGRQKISFVCGEQQQWLLQYQRDESDLIYRNGEFYLLATCDVPDDAPIDPEGYLGVDLGIKNITVDSDGNIHSARHLLNVRHRHRRLRRKLQKKRIWSAFRKLKALSGKERRFAHDVNHCISK